ncbi:phage integrase family protein [Rubrivivax gelatinosus]|uniref:phage integrase family protein n=1 Tax=Rubrivivax gelatinosus TaxID=28068 RepID=UPI000309F69E|nr:phage integrase family protein [Rubrivivax gelatinosus]MBG6083226.1 integrase [Rubrivivax gelatinosus]
MTADPASSFTDLDDFGETLKRRPGRPAGKKMVIAAEQLRHSHFAFLRALQQGISLRRAWDTYLGYEGGPDDERHFGSRLREVLSLVRIAAARRKLDRQAEIALAGLERLAPRPTRRATEAPRHRPTSSNALAAATAVLGLPSLDEWIGQRCADLGVEPTYQSRADWQDEYEDEFDLDRAAAPARAITIADTALPSPALPSTTALPKELPPLDKRLDALNQLMHAIARPPALTDPLDSWLSADLAARLARAGVGGKPQQLPTLANLIAFVNLHHYRWWVHVPRVGADRAQRLMDWLVPLAEALGQPIKELARRPLMVIARERRAQLSKVQDPKRFGMVPLDRLAVPPELDGRHGTFRAVAESTSGADNDLDAIILWLRTFKGSPRTLVSHSRIVERFYLWCLLVKRKPMSSLVEDDFGEYREFLAAPPADWVQVRRVTRETSEWRPFRGPLRPTVIRLNFSVIASMFSALVKNGYLRADASKTVLPSVRLPYLRINIDRSFTDAQWHWLMTCWRDMYRDVGPAFAADEEQPLLPDSKHPDVSSVRAAYLRRTRLALELGATTGLRLIEFVTTRAEAIQRVVVDGEEVWLMKVEGKGKRKRELIIYDDVKALLDQHHADMVSAKTDFDPSNEHVRKLRIPGAANALPSPTHGPVASPPLLLGDSESSEGDRESEASKGADGSQLPLLGALRRSPRPRAFNDLGLQVLGEDTSRNTDRYGSLDPTALYQSLQRFFKACARRATRSELDLVDVSQLESASTHWLRHFFANSAINDGLDPVAVQEMMGHSSLATTSIYLRQNRTRLLQGMKTLKRRA